MASERLDSGQCSSALALAKQLARAGQVEKAESTALSYLDANPGDTEGWQFLGRLMQSTRRFEEALSYAGRAVDVAPNSPQALLEYGLLLAASGRRRDALAIARRLGSDSLATAEFNTARGTLLTYCDEPEGALASFEAAAKQYPDSCECLFNWASAKRMIGDLSGAEDTLQHVIRLSPHHGAAHLMRSGLRKQSESVNHIAEIQTAVRHVNRDRDDSIKLQFALGKELEDVRRFEEAFNAFQLGCRMQRQRMQYDVSVDVGVIDRIIQTHSRIVIDTCAGFRTEEPIFVMGLPRSGTTLVAQILAGHSGVYSVGETPALAAETIGAVRRRAGRDVGKLEFASQVLELDARDLGRAYLEAARPGNATHFVDKTPINYLYIGVIARSLPRAKIVVVARDPMDVCFAMFKTLFTGAYPFSYDLVELGRYYAAWHRLIRHWQNVLGKRVLVIQYEDLINDPPSATDRLLKYCGLQWEEACLDFSEIRNPVTTESAVQIRQPLYSTSVGNSKHYERHLDLLRSTLAKNLLLGARLAS